MPFYRVSNPKHRTELPHWHKDQLSVDLSHFHPQTFFLKLIFHHQSPTASWTISSCPALYLPLDPNGSREGEAGDSAQPSLTSIQFAFTS